MSGSNYGPYVPPARSKFDCETGQIKTNVSSVDLEVLDKLKVGDKLEVSVLEKKAVVYNVNGELLGSIINPNTLDLIKCMEDKYEYEGCVIEIQSLNVSF